MPGHIEMTYVDHVRQRFQVGHDLFVHVPVTRRSIRSDHYQIDRTSLHQMPAGAIGDDRMRDTMLTELPGSEFGALTSRPGLIDPDMNRQTAIMRRIDRRQGRSVIHKRKPARVTMG